MHSAHSFPSLKYLFHRASFSSAPCRIVCFLIHDDTCWCHFTAGQKLQVPLSVLSHVLLHFLHHLIQPLLFVFSHCLSHSLAMVGIFPASVHISALFLRAFTQTLTCTNTHAHYIFLQPLMPSLWGFASALIELFFFSNGLKFPSCICHILTLLPWNRV